jgi:hypothetical protein
VIQDVDAARATHVGVQSPRCGHVRGGGPNVEGTTVAGAGFDLHGIHQHGERVAPGKTRTTKAHRGRLLTMRGGGQGR